MDISGRAGVWGRSPQQAEVVPKVGSERSEEPCRRHRLKLVNILKDGGRMGIPFLGRGKSGKGASAGLEQ